ncbi:hypothetical protein [Streptomyces sp. NPDC058745]|uniref:hypothetical protein n=1 Tax=Streptomyces sp. NPDC058745 TaxID=3346621 RepID=UPI00367F8231
MSQDRTQTAAKTPAHPTAREALRRSRVADLRVVQPARRTLQQMAPGYVRQPVLVLHRPKFRSPVPCLFCDRWSCPGNCGTTAAPAPAATAVKQVA